jgi:hypothetical protein
VVIFEEEACDKEGDFSPRLEDNSEEVSDEDAQASYKFHCTTATTDKKQVRFYNGSYLSMGFTWTNDLFSSFTVPRL